MTNRMREGKRVALAWGESLRPHGEIWVSILRCSRHALKDGGGHACYLKPYAFLAERVNKFSERRKFSCIRHRSSGVAARLLANRIFSCSLRPLPGRSSRFLMAASFFCSHLDATRRTCPLQR